MSGLALEDRPRAIDGPLKAIAADFPQYDKARHFAFNWGVQKARSGNDVYSIGVYELRACPAA